MPMGCATCLLLLLLLPIRMLLIPRLCVCGENISGVGFIIGELKASAIRAVQSRGPFGYRLASGDPRINSLEAFYPTRGQESVHNIPHPHRRVLS